ncbi:MAG: DUF4268 domain-containing protein [Bacteroidales bacterium]|nr:DUF4268 domain-containing protein [Bacteroidales bacterium]
MYSKEEFKQLKVDFWTKFGIYSQRKRQKKGLDKKWLLYKTDIKGIELKFDLEEKSCLTTIEIDLRQSISNSYIEKINLLKDELKDKTDFKLEEQDLFLAGDKYVYRYYYQLNDLSFKNKDNWPLIFQFFFKHMLALENFILENKDILKE